jgi:hypothetical protein
VGENRQSRHRDAPRLGAAGEMLLSEATPGEGQPLLVRPPPLAALCAGASCP